MRAATQAWSDTFESASSTDAPRSSWVSAEKAVSPCPVGGSADSGGQCNSRSEISSIGLAKPSRLRGGSVVGLVGDGVELGLGDGGKVGAVGEVLAHEAVGVLVGTALSGRVRVAEQDLDLSGDLQVLSVGHAASASGPESAATTNAASCVARRVAQQSVAAPGH